MGTVIDFYTAREVRPTAPASARCRCGICGADLWHISASGEVCCADCETVCPYRIEPASGGRRAECTLATTEQEKH
jgi:hypothetical protein